MKAVDVGVVGLGAIAKKAHLPVLSSFPDVNVRAICDTNLDRCKRRAKEWDVAKIYVEYEEMFEKSSFDAVFVCVPPYLHHRVVSDALEQGYHVFCEKPMGVSSSEAYELVKSAQRRDLVLGVGYNKRLQKSYIKAREAIRDSKVGKVTQINAISVIPGPYVGWIASTDWFFEEKGGGVLYDTMTHMIDLVLFILSQNIEEVSAKSTMSREDLPVPDNVTALFNTEGSILGTVSSGWGAGGMNEMIGIYGTGGCFLANPFRFLSIHGKRSPLEVAGSPLNFLRGLLLTRAGNMNPLDGMDETYLKEDRSFIDAVLGRGEPSATCLDALRVLETLEALRMSLENGKSVKVKHRRT